MAAEGQRSVAVSWALCASRMACTSPCVGGSLMVIVSGERLFGLRVVPARGGVDAGDPRRHPARMSTLTVELSDDLAARLAAASESKHVPPAQIVAEALEKTLPEPLAEPSADEPSLYDLMKDGLGCVSSGVPDLATNPKHMEGFGQCRK